MHGIFIIIYLYWIRAGWARSLPAVLRHYLGLFITFNAVCFAWIFFRANSTADAHWIASHLLPLNNADKLGNLGLTGGEMLVTIVAVMILEFVQFFERNKGGVAFLEKQKLSTRWICYYTLFFYIIILGEFGGARFIYFQF